MTVGLWVKYTLIPYGPNPTHDGAETSGSGASWDVAGISGVGSTTPRVNDRHIGFDLRGRQSLLAQNVREGTERERAKFKSAFCPKKEGLQEQQEKGGSERD